MRKQYTFSKAKACSLKDGRHNFPVAVNRPQDKGVTNYFWKKGEMLSYIVEVDSEFDTEQYLYTYDCKSKKAVQQIDTKILNGTKDSKKLVSIIGVTSNQIILHNTNLSSNLTMKVESIISNLLDFNIYTISSKKYTSLDISKFQWYTAWISSINKELQVIFDRRMTEERCTNDKSNCPKDVADVMYSLGNWSDLSITNYNISKSTASIKFVGSCDRGMQCGDSVGKATINFSKKTITLPKKQ